MDTIRPLLRSITFREEIELMSYRFMLIAIFLSLLMGSYPLNEASPESLPQYVAGVMVKSYDEKRAKTLEKFEEIIGKYMEEKAHIKLRLKAMTYEDLLRESANGTVDFIWGYGHIVSMELLEKLPIVPFIAPTLGVQRRPTFGRLLLTSSREITTPEALRGKRLTFIGDEAWSLEIFLLKLWLREKLGLKDLNQFITLKELKSDEGFFIPGSRRGSIYSILIGEADAAIAHEFEYIIQEKLTPNAIKEKAHVAPFFNTSEQYFEAPAFARKGLPPKDVEALIQALLKMSEDPEGQQILISSKISGFVRVKEQDYKSIKEIIERKRKHGI